MRILVLIAFMVLALPAPAPAWHKYGHMAVARIAWQQLDAKERKRIDAILKAHVHDGIDHYKVYLLAELPTKPMDAITENEWAFARAAVWSDWIRNPKQETDGLSAKQSESIKTKFHKGPWHYINLPLVHPADAEFVGAAKLADMRKSRLEPEFDGKGEPRHVVAALKHALKNLRDPKGSDADKAVALCWLMHLVGDVHQPLHASGLIARAESLPKTKFEPPPFFEAPEGDAGGNRVAVKPAKDAAAVNLHFYWDALVFDDRTDFTEFDRRLQQLQRHGDYQPDKLPELKIKEFLAWAEESHALAKTVAYRKAGNPDSEFLNATPLPKGLSFAQQKQLMRTLDAPVLTPEYRENATRTAERRIVVAGYRLAVQLKAALR
jgi:hypothetical protein